MTERDAAFTVIAEDMEDATDAEDKLYDALRELHDYRRTDDRQHLINAEIAIKQAYVGVHDQIEDATPEVRE